VEQRALLDGSASIKSLDREMIAIQIGSPGVHAQNDDEGTENLTNIGHENEGHRELYFVALFRNHSIN
jgi:hypothetical protein